MGLLWNILENSGKPKLTSVAHTVLISVPTKTTMLTVYARILAIWLGILITSDLNNTERESIYIIVEDSSKP